MLIILVSGFSSVVMFSVIGGVFSDDEAGFVDVIGFMLVMLGESSG